MRISDWSSDVCSSDLGELGQYEQAEAACLESVATLDQIRAPGLLEKWAMAEAQAMLAYTYERAGKPRAAIDARRRQIEARKSVVSGKSVSVRVDLGGRRISNKKKPQRSKKKVK